MDPYKQVGRPNWSAETMIEGLDISDETRRVLAQQYGNLLVHEYFQTLKHEAYLFLRMDIKDFRSPDGAKFLKAFVERSSWPLTQKKIAVLVCSLEERLQHRNILDNVCCSGVKWQQR